MRLLTRSYVSEMIRDQFKVTNKQIDIYFIKRKYGIVPYKKEGKTALYKLDDLLSIGLYFQDFLEGFYPIPHYKDKYWINKESDIININNGKIIHPYKGVDEYGHITLVYKGKKYRKRVHSLMGKVFLGNPPVVNHLDSDKFNNKLSNLERSTHSLNIKHAYDNDKYTTRGGTGTSVIGINKETGEETLFKSLRQAEKATKIDRHRIKIFLSNKQVTNNTNWDFKFK